MTEKIGTIILAFEQRAFLLEEGGGAMVYEFNPETIDGNLDPQARKFPARLQGAIAKFAVDENNVVTTVSTLVFRKLIHNTCDHSVVSLAVKNCACGNVTNSVYRHCEVCAIRNGHCVLCGEGETLS